MKENEKGMNIDYEIVVKEVRKACRQFAMLYFHFAKVLYEELGEEKAKQLIQRTVFELGIDRSDILREQALNMGIELSPENFDKIKDIPTIGWVKELGRNHCPYAEIWMEYFDSNPWFRELASFYCDVIDTTNIENFNRQISHKIIKNVLNGDDICDRIYFESDDVKKGYYSYGRKKASIQNNGDIKEDEK